jgi:hypothetical protein
MFAVYMFLSLRDCFISSVVQHDILDSLKFFDGSPDMHSCSGGFLGALQTDSKDGHHAFVKLFSVDIFTRNVPSAQISVVQRQ